ncbi:hypothetical protein CVT26_014523 [Gymnopilus dilepis]|uniref:Uncharacterized protein n=1 Tax=Gymnopilus dilepis TaxID=231916 RepID=A0A409W385_9AGAR|nr:hypothetical protein CVT26_014523 [Gymnopilus dilepis]
MGLYGQIDIKEVGRTREDGHERYHCYCGKWKTLNGMYFDLIYVSVASPSNARFDRAPEVVISANVPIVYGLKTAKVSAADEEIFSLLGRSCHADYFHKLEEQSAGVKEVLSQSFFMPSHFSDDFRQETWDQARFEQLSIE